MSKLNKASTISGRNATGSTSTKSIGGVRTGRTSSKTASSPSTPRAGAGIAEQDVTPAAGAIDMDQLADLLVQRLHPQAAHSQSACFGRISGVEVPDHPGITKSVVDQRMAALSSNQLGQMPTKTPPVEAEFNQMSIHMETVDLLISDLINDLEPMLAYEEVSDKDASCLATRSSESPLHRRLIDRNDALEQIIWRLRHLNSRIRN